MCDSNAYEHIGAVRRTESVPGGHLIGGTQSVPVPVPVPQDKNGQPVILKGYWGVLGPDFRTVGPKRRPGAQNEARPQSVLCQGGRKVGYKSACHVLETARDGSRR